MANSFFERLKKPIMGVGIGLRASATQKDEDIPVIKTVVKQITAVQLRTMNATPISVIAAPGSGKANVPLYMHAWLDYNSAAFDAVGASDNLCLRYTDGSGTILTVDVAGQSFFDATSDQHRFVKGITTEITPLENTAIVAHIKTGEIYSAAGNSPLNLHITYLEIPFTFSV